MSFPGNFPFPPFDPPGGMNGSPVYGNPGHPPPFPQFRPDFGGSSPNCPTCPGTGSCPTGGPKCSGGSAGRAPSASGTLAPNAAACSQDCLAADEPVLLADGSVLPACEIRVGHRLCTLGVLARPMAGAGGSASASAVLDRATETVVRLRSSLQPLLEIRHEDGAFKCSPSHLLVLADGSTRAAERLAPGDGLLAASGGRSEVLVIESAGEARVFGWTCEPSHTFIASGLVHHNKGTIHNQPIPSTVLGL